MGDDAVVFGGLVDVGLQEKDLKSSDQAARQILSGHFCSFRNQLFNCV